MANLSITPANFRMTDSSDATIVYAGESLQPGQPLYLKQSDARWYKALSGGTAEESQVAAISAGYAVAGAKVAIVTSRSIVVGATIDLTKIYFLSATAGLICPYEDLVSGNYISQIGIPTSTTTMSLLLSPQGIVVP